MSYIGAGFRTLKFDKAAVQELLSGHTRNAFILLSVLAVLVGIVVGLAASVLSRFLGPSSGALGALGFVGGLVAGIVLVFVISFIGYGITHLFAKLFGGKNTFMAYFAAAVSVGFALTIASIGAGILSLIPLLGILINIAFTIYSICVTVFLVRESYAISTLKAFFALLLPAIILLVVMGVIAYIGVLSPATLA